MPDGDLLYIATDLKQYTHCPRITYYENCLPDFRPYTYLMEAGREAHEEERIRAARRTLRAYGLVAGERHVDVSLRSERLGLAGKVDEVIYVAGDPPLAYPVDYKLTDRLRPQHRLQIAAYALLIEDCWGVQAPEGFVYLIVRRRAERVKIDQELRQAVMDALTDIRQIVEWERMPPVVVSSRQCAVCEFRRICNDR